MEKEKKRDYRKCGLANECMISIDCNQSPIRIEFLSVLLFRPPLSFSGLWSLGPADKSISFLNPENDWADEECKRWKSEGARQQQTCKKVDLDCRHEKWNQRTASFLFFFSLLHQQKFLIESSDNNSFVGNFFSRVFVVFAVWMICTFSRRVRVCRRSKGQFRV